MRCLLLIGLLALSGVGYAQSLPEDYTFSNVGMTFLSVSSDARSALLFYYPKIKMRSFQINEICERLDYK